jgi:hypothetical protein
MATSPLEGGLGRDSPVFSWSRMYPSNLEEWWTGATGQGDSTLVLLP